MNKNHIVLLISKVRKNASVFLEREMLNRGISGLVASHGSILGALYRNNGKLKMKEIADLIDKDKSTVTYLVNGLYKEGYVIREKGNEDSRETYIKLTEKAEQIKESFQPISQQLINTAYKGFTDDEQEKLFELLEKMNNNFKS